MEEQIEVALSESTLSDDELNSDQSEHREEWIDNIIPDESISQVAHITDSEVNTNSEISTLTTAGSTVWLYFDKNPSDTLGYNVCKKCSKKFKITTSMSTLRTHLKTHQLKAPTKKQAVVIKKKNPFDEEEQNKHDEHLIQ